MAENKQSEEEAPQNVTSVRSNLSVKQLRKKTTLGNVLKARGLNGRRSALLPDKRQSMFEKEIGEGEGVSSRSGPSSKRESEITMVEATDTPNLSRHRRMPNRVRASFAAIDPLDELDSSLFRTNISRSSEGDSHNKAAVPVSVRTMATGPSMPSSREKRSSISFMTCEVESVNISEAKREAGLEDFEKDRFSSKLEQEPNKTSRLQRAAVAARLATAVSGRPTALSARGRSAGSGRATNAMVDKML